MIQMISLTLKCWAPEMLYKVSIPIPLLVLDAFKMCTNKHVNIQRHKHTNTITYILLFVYSDNKIIS